MGNYNKTEILGRLLILVGPSIPYGRQVFIVPAHYAGKLTPAMNWTKRKFGYCLS